MTETRRIAADARGRLLTIFAVAALLLALLPLGQAHAQDDFDYGEYVENEGEDDDLVPSVRYRGDHRFGTAGLIAHDTFPDGSDTVLMARADLFPDALSGNYLAGALGVPILLTPSNEVFAATADILEELGAEEVILLGGTDALDETVESDLEDAGYEVDRVSGPTRFDTAGEIALRGSNDGADIGTREHDGEDKITALVARGDDFADALAGGPLSVDQNWPLLLSFQTEVNAETAGYLDDLGIEHAILLGGTAALGEGVTDDLEDMGITWERRSGPTRVHTAVDIAEFEEEELGWMVDHVNFARGNEFPDALTVGPHAGFEQSPLLLTARSQELEGEDMPVTNYLTERNCLIMSIHFAGGFAAINEAVGQEIREAATSDEPCFIELTPEVDVNSVEDEDHTVEARYLNAAGVTFEGDIRIEVWREDPLDLGVFVLLDEGSVESPGEFTYDSDDPAHGDNDVILACNDEDECTEGGLSPTFDEDGNLENPNEDAEFLALAEKLWVDTEDATETFDLDLSSENEVGDNTAVDEEPPFTGVGTIWTFNEENVVCWDVDIDVVDGIGSFEAFAAAAPVSASHIHEGDDETAGPIVIDLGTPDDEDGQTTGCTFADSDLIDDIEANPTEFYFNAHTDLFPGGVVRDQLA